MRQGPQRLVLPHCPIAVILLVIAWRTLATWIAPQWSRSATYSLSCTGAQQGLSHLLPPQPFCFSTSLQASPSPVLPSAPQGCSTLWQLGAQGHLPYVLPVGETTSVSHISDLCLPAPWLAVLGVGAAEGLCLAALACGDSGWGWWQRQGCSGLSGVHSPSFYWNCLKWPETCHVVGEEYGPFWQMLTVPRRCVR